MVKIDGNELGLGLERVHNLGQNPTGMTWISFEYTVGFMKVMLIQGLMNIKLKLNLMKLYQVLLLLLWLLRYVVFVENIHKYSYCVVKRE